MCLEWPHVQQTECILFVFLNKKEAGHFLQKAGPGVKWYFPPESDNVVTYEPMTSEPKQTITAILKCISHFHFDSSGSQQRQGALFCSCPVCSGCLESPAQR